MLTRLHLDVFRSKLFLSRASCQSFVCYSSKMPFASTSFVGCLSSCVPYRYHPTFPITTDSEPFIFHLFFFFHTFTCHPARPPPKWGVGGWISDVRRYCTRTVRVPYCNRRWSPMMPSRPAVCLRSSFRSLPLHVRLWTSLLAKSTCRGASEGCVG